MMRRGFVSDATANMDEHVRFITVYDDQKIREEQLV